jgi:hypothetical protein
VSLRMCAGFILMMVVIVIDKNGRVAWAKVESDYKVRPSNADIRAALQLLK